MTSVENQPLPEFIPDGVEEVRVDPGSGLLAGAGCRRGMTVPFDVEGVPTATSTCGAAPAAAPLKTAKKAPDSGSEKKAARNSGDGEFMRSFWGE